VVSALKPARAVSLARRQQMKFRKIISTTLIGAMLFFAPSMIPIRAFKAVADTAFADGVIVAPSPPAPGHAHTPVWPWVVIGCAGSIVLSAVVADFWSHRELTTPEAWTCGLLYWVPMPYQPQPVQPAVRTKG
jgi:hypothetical protein